MKIPTTEPYRSIVQLLQDNLELRPARFEELPRGQDCGIWYIPDSKSRFNAGILRAITVIKDYYNNCYCMGPKDCSFPDDNHERHPKG